MMRRFSEIIRGKAPGISGAVLCLWAVLATVACGKKSGTPDWDTPGGEAPAAMSAEQAPATVSKPQAEEVAKPPQPVAVPRDASTDGLRFMAFNVENWLTMDRYVDNERLSNAAKPEVEKSAAVSLMARHRPDIIGLCEIGTLDDLKEIQAALKAAGVDLPHMHYAGGSDPVRHLGLLSKFPITATAEPEETSFKVQGKNYSFNRSVLDGTVEAQGKSYRFLGVHLKSKREVEEGDQELMRQGEARLLRKHVDSILDADGGARLVVYGDFNDTRPSPSFRTVTGNYNDPKYLTAIPAKDSRGDAWTHHWKPHDIYSRIDFVTVSRALRGEVDFDRSYIVDDEGWSEASDHRAILAIFR
jgi:endonuclease/exonuclease/phosphatase family metal-dependent hydrolase